VTVIPGGENPLALTLRLRNPRRAMRPSWTDISAIVAALAIVAAAVKFVFVGGQVEYDSLIGKIIFQTNKSDPAPQFAQFAGEEGKPRPGSNNTVWESSCPPKTVPISGTCVVDAGQKNVPALQNVGPNIAQGINRWECAWQGAVEKASVRAVCVRTEK
jgi:hypothetical protein